MPERTRQWRVGHNDEGSGDNKKDQWDWFNPFCHLINLLASFFPSSQAPERARRRLQ
jgi:hypothetical protein